MLTMLSEKKTLLVVLLGLYLGLVFIPAGYFLYFSPYFNDAPLQGVVKSPEGKGGKESLEPKESTQTPVSSGGTEMKVDVVEITPTKSDDSTVPLDKMPSESTNLPVEDSSNVSTFGKLVK